MADTEWWRFLLPHSATKSPPLAPLLSSAIVKVVGSMISIGPLAVFRDGKVVGLILELVSHCGTRWIRGVSSDVVAWLPRDVTLLTYVA